MLHNIMGLSIEHRLQRQERLPRYPSTAPCKIGNVYGDPLVNHGIKTHCPTCSELKPTVPYHGHPQSRTNKWSDVHETGKTSDKIGVVDSGSCINGGVIYKQLLFIIIVQTSLTIERRYRYIM